jgi:integrase
MFIEIDYTKKAFETAVRIDNTDTEYKVKGKSHMRLLVYKNRKSLMVRKCWQGKRHSKTLGSFPTMNLKVFERLAHEYCERIEKGELNKLSRRVTLNRFFDRIYLELAKKNKKSWKSDLGRYNLYVRGEIGEYWLGDIKSFGVQCLLSDLPEHLSDSSHDLIRALMSSIFSFAIKFELLDKNPVSVIPARNNCKVNTHIPTEAELIAFIKACLVEADPAKDNFSFHALCLLLMIFTGMRISECCSVRKDMIDPDYNAIYLANTKQGKPDTKFLSKQARWVVKTAASASWNDYVFPSTVKDNLPISYPRSVFVRICKRAGIAVNGSDHPIQDGFSTEPFHIHAGRKSFCSYVLKQTGDIRLASTLLGHSTLSVTEKHYAFFHDSRLQNVVSAVADDMTASIVNFPTLEANILR